MHKKGKLKTELKKKNGKIHLEQHYHLIPSPHDTLC